MGKNWGKFMEQITINGKKIKRVTCGLCKEHPVRYILHLTYTLDWVFACGCHREDYGFSIDRFMTWEDQEHWVCHLSKKHWVNIHQFNKMREVFNRCFGIKKPVDNLKD